MRYPNFISSTTNWPKMVNTWAKCDVRAISDAFNLSCSFSNSVTCFSSSLLLEKRRLSSQQCNHSFLNISMEIFWHTWNFWFVHLCMINIIGTTASKFKMNSSSWRLIQMFSDCQDTNGFQTSILYHLPPKD